MGDRPIPAVEAKHQDVREELAAMAAAQRRAAPPVASDKRGRNSSDDRIAAALFGSISSPRPSS
jgi:hypothetical protein